MFMYPWEKNMRHPFHGIMCRRQQWCTSTNSVLWFCSWLLDCWISYQIIKAWGFVSGWNYHKHRRHAVTRGELIYLAPLGSEKIFRPLFQAVFLSWGGDYPPDWVKHHASQSQDRNNKYFILYIEYVAADLLFRLTRMRHAWKGDCYLTVLVFHGRYYFYSLKFILMFINERKRNANTYLISNFDSLEAAPSNRPS